MRKTDPAHAAVDRALRLVLMLRETEAVSVTDVANRLDVSPSTAHRFLAAFRERDFAVQDDDRRYRAGPNIDARASHRSLNELRAMLRPHLVSVQASLSETVNLWVLEGLLVRNVTGVESTQPLSIRASSWDGVPAYLTAAGKALLAEFDDVEVGRMHRSGLPEWPSSAHISSVHELVTHLDRVRADGFATNREEVTKGVCGVAVAVRTSTSDGPISLSCGVPSVRFSAQRGRQIAQTLSSAAAEMAATLEGQ